jgi:hypothetical protein
MAKIHAKIATVLVALTAGFVAISVTPASTASADACYDFIRIYFHYVDVGDTATADAVYRNLVRDGCVEEV